jgi:predicted acetyltransferase
MAITYRPITVDEMVPFFEADAFGFGHDFDPSEGSWMDQLRSYAELDRTTAAFEDGTIVGTAGIWSFDLTVPGATVPTAGTTWVSVRPTHRRRGVLTGMMRTHLDNIHARGEALAALWASESPIYGRFGYGLAAEGVEMKIDRAHSGLRHVVPFSGRTRLVTRDEALTTWPGVYERVRPGQPGMISRHEAWWSKRHLREPERPRAGFTKSFRVQYEEEGEALGYVRYRIGETFEAGSATSTLLVGELMAATDAAHSALWSYIFGVDLIGTIKMEWGRVDEPLLHMLEDPRRLVRRTQDTLFVRVVDVAKALAARRYAAAGRIVIDVEDAFCPWNSGRYLLEGGTEGARCTKTDAAAEVALDAETLGALYLGGTRFQAMARAGRVQGTPEALRRADAMFAWHPLPWIPEIF